MTNEHGKLDSQGHVSIKELPGGNLKPSIDSSVVWTGEKESASLSIDHTKGEDTKVKSINSIIINRLTENIE